MINFEKLNVYQDSIKLALDIYKITKKFPKDELYGIVSQIRKASVSISLNLAEGSSRSKKDFSRFIDIARGSCYELIPLLTISFELMYLDKRRYEEFYKRVDYLAKRLNALKKSVNR